MNPHRWSLTQRTDCGNIRRAALPFLHSCQDTGQVEDSLLVITELVQNVIRHAGGNGRLDLTRHPEAVLIEVSDASRNVPDALASDPRRIGGRGLHLVRGVSLAWGVRRITGGKVVWAEVAVAGSAATI